jgi:ubiquinone/menaquinone biosynthesis C-methylase UbiE
MEADAERLDFPDGSFDAVLWRWGLTDLPKPSNALLAIRRMLAANGSFVTAVWDAGPKARPLVKALRSSRAPADTCVENSAAAIPRMATKRMLKLRKTVGASVYRNR